MAQVNTKMNIAEKLKNLPQKPGCYLFKDKNANILYVGKAAGLRQRVRSYFQDSRPEHPRLRAMINKTTDVEWIVTDSEVEALILENNLIKEHKPRYNVSLRDDKSYPYIRITNEDFPRVFVTRRIVRDGSQYFGPYTDVKNVRYTLKTLQRIFPVRSCSYDLTPEVIRKKKVRLCLDYYIDKCKGPCEGLQSMDDYAKIIDRVRRFLKGKTDEIVKELKEEMTTLAQNMAFEDAARVRDRLDALETYRNSQKIVQSEHVDRDIVTVAKEDDDACAVLFKVREGKIIGRSHYYLKKVEWKREKEIVEIFLNQYYQKSDEIPREVFVQDTIENQSAVEQWLSGRLQRKVNIISPKIGEKKKLMKLGVKNARYLLSELKLQKEKAKNYIPHAVKALQRDLKLEKPPVHIECFDVSNLQGADAVASMVYFENGKPKKSQYRRFNIRTKETPDDFAMMKEAVKRRYTRLLNEAQSLPDLIVIDGGKGQLSSVTKILSDLQLQHIPIIGLAKRLEEIYFPGINDAQMLPKSSSGLKLLQRIRDEAHRFAITAHRQKRSKRTLASELDAIAGIGIKRREKLLKTFGSVKSIQNTNVQTLVAKGHLPEKIAKKVVAYFQKHPIE
ncbi:MAG: excinuclease ABC subunit C [Caldithrix sp.]|nr:excinuclease ABC subunit C [Caldithrix sp.]